MNAATGETDEGAHIDQADYNRNPLYAAEGAPAGDTRLDQTTPDPDVTKKNDWGRHGFRYTDASGALKEQDALLNDETGLNNGATDSAQIYETTALAIKGNQKDSYYGSVEWGWRTDSGGAFTKLPLKVISQGVPSSTFMKSAELWNSGTTASGASTLDLLRGQPRGDDRQQAEAPRQGLRGVLPRQDREHRRAAATGSPGA
ncbi:MAG TPA: hypothetical protein VF516_41720 [Kofleriaceae bacterium]